MALVNYHDAAKTAATADGVTGYHIMLHDPMQAPLVRERLTPQLPYGVYASDWSVDNASYFSAVQTEKNAMFIILCLIVMVAAFGLLSSMYMVVTEKRRDIAILRTMGMTRRQIGQIFLTQGLTFGAFGTVLGVGLGILIAVNVPAIMAFRGAPHRLRPAPRKCTSSTNCRRKSTLPSSAASASSPSS